MSILKGGAKTAHGDSQNVSHWGPSSGRVSTLHIVRTNVWSQTPLPTANTEGCRAPGPQGAKMGLKGSGNNSDSNTWSPAAFCNPV